MDMTVFSVQTPSSGVYSEYQEPYGIGTQEKGSSSFLRLQVNGV